MISTATAAVNAAPTACPAASHPGQGHHRDADDDRDEHRGDPVRQPLHRRLADLRLLHQAGYLGKLGIGTDPGGAHHQTPAGVDAPAGHRITLAHLGRDQLAGEHRGVHGRAAGGDDPVGGDLLPRPDHELLAHCQLLPRDPYLDAVAQHHDVPGAQRQRRPQRRARAPPGAGLVQSFPPYTLARQTRPAATLCDRTAMTAG